MSEETGFVGSSGWANHFSELRLYKQAMDLADEIYRLSKCFPREEPDALTDQVRRSSGSIGANVAEAWSKQRYPAAFASKLSDADAEAMETADGLGVARRCGYLRHEGSDRLRQDLISNAGSLQKIMRNAERWRTE